MGQRDKHRCFIAYLPISVLHCTPHPSRGDQVPVTIAVNLHDFSSLKYHYHKEMILRQFNLKPVFKEQFFLRYN
jgi:hypothetical protein